jgi:hypothetical protein
MRLRVLLVGLPWALGILSRDLGSLQRAGSDYSGCYNLSVGRWSGHSLSSPLRVPPRIRLDTGRVQYSYRAHPRAVAPRLLPHSGGGVYAAVWELRGDTVLVIWPLGADGSLVLRLRGTPDRLTGTAILSPVPSDAPAVAERFTCAT